MERRSPAVCKVSDHKEGKDEMTKASIDLQDLRRRIYVKAKAETSWKFWGLYVHVCKLETLREAYALAKKNDGAPGSDGVTFEAIEAQGVEALLEQIADELVGRCYAPLPARRQEIPKDGGKVRVLSIPAIRDRVAQGALKLILEPIFEADFQSGSFGYRPQRTAHEAVDRVARAIVQHKTRVIDIDLRSYLDAASYCPLVHQVRSKSSGCRVTALIRSPFCLPRMTWTASSSPRLTRCNTVWRETPSAFIASRMGMKPSPASLLNRAMTSSVNRMRHGAPGVSCSPGMIPALSKRWRVEGATPSLRWGGQYFRSSTAILTFSLWE